MFRLPLLHREAYSYVKERRACIKPNEGFVAQLAEYEPIYRARQTLEKGETSSSCDTRRQKRKSEQLTEVVDINLIQPPPSPSDNINDDEIELEEKLQDVHDISNNLHRLWLLKGL